MVFVFSRANASMLIIITLLMSSCGDMAEEQQVKSRRSGDLTINLPASEVPPTNGDTPKPKGNEDALPKNDPADLPPGTSLPLPDQPDSGNQQLGESQLGWNGVSFIGNSKLAIMPVE